MSVNTNNSLTLTNVPAGRWRYGINYHEPSSQDRNDNQNWHSNSVPVSLSQHHHYSIEDQGSNSPWRLFEERVRTGPFGLTRFPSQPYAPVRILMIRRSNLEDRVNPRLREFISNSPPRIRGEWHLNLPTEPEPEDRGLTNEEFRKAMKLLKKQTYNPQRKRTRKRGGLFGTRNNNSVSSDDVEAEQGSKECIICLEAFAPYEQVLVTPCNHMFHNDCVVPWVKSHGKCPVCRFVLCERSHNTLSRGSNNYYTSNGNNNNVLNTSGDEDFALELIALIRAMEEAFNWVDTSYL